MNSTKSILLVEADAVISSGLCQVLAKTGFSVSVVRCLRDALGQLSTSTGYSAIICEYYLPDGTGLELLDQLRGDRGLRVPVLLIAGNWTKPMRVQPGLAYLTKPFDGAQLLGALRELLQTPQTDAGTVTQPSPI